MSDLSIHESISEQPEKLAGDHALPRGELFVVLACSILLITLTACKLWPISWLEVWGFITGGICVWLTVRENVWTWPVGIANNIVFLVLFWQGRLYADASLQIVYIALSIYGWLSWHGKTPESRLQIKYASRTEWLICIVFVTLATWCLSHILVAVNGAAPFWDAFTTSLSLAAQGLMCRKRIDHWLIWILADIVYVPLYFKRGLPLTSALYLGFLLLCVAGFKRWSGLIRLQKGQRST